MRPELRRKGKQEKSKKKKNQIFSASHTKKKKIIMMMIKLPLITTYMTFSAFFFSFPKVNFMFLDHQCFSIFFYFCNLQTPFCLLVTSPQLEVHIFPHSWQPDSNSDAVIQFLYEHEVILIDNIGSVDWSIRMLMRAKHAAMGCARVAKSYLEY